MTSWIIAHWPWLLLAVCLLALAALSLCKAAGSADRRIAEALAPLSPVTDGFAQMGDAADNVTWLFPEPDERPRFTVIRGGGQAA